MVPFWALLFVSLLTISASIEERQTYIVRVKKDEKPSVFSSAEQWYRSTVRSLTSSLRSEEGSPNPGDDLLHVYKTVFHGFSAQFTASEVEELKNRRSVLAVFPDRIHRLLTTRSPSFLGLTGASNLLKEADYGSNLVIGMLDSGISPDRRSFHDRDLSPVPTHWKGECMEGPGFKKTNCNRKIIGARFFPSGYEAARGKINATKEFRSARDSDGHGTHTASTAAGRLVSNVSLQGYASGDAVGVAPKARLAVYKICWSSGCHDSDLLAAIDKAVEDGVDIISLSVGASPTPLYADPIAMGAFGAIEKGVFLSASAGNEGPGRMTVTNISPWITTVGAGTMDRSFPADVLLGDGTVISGISVYGDGNFPVKKFFPLYSAWNKTQEGDAFKGQLCMKGSLKPELVRGKIVICERGGIPRVEKGETVKEAGGVGMIIANAAPAGYALTADSHVLPTVAIGEKDGYDLHGYLVRSLDPQAAFVFHGTRVKVKPAPTVAGYSSRGPNLDSTYIIKPDVLAPGSDILAAWPDSIGPTSLPSDTRRTEFNLLSGTSMACPHISGVAALLKGSHPDWSPAAIRSALMTTAYVNDSAGNALLDESSRNASTVWDMGSGHVDPRKAMDPGLIYDLSAEDYVDFLCSSNYSWKTIRAIIRRPAKCSRRRGRPWDINYPSISVVFAPSDDGKSSEVDISRTVTNVGDGAASYTVSVVNPPGATVTVEPSKLNFTEKGEKLKFVVKVSALNVKLTSINSYSVFGTLTWSDGRHVVRSPIVVTWQLYY
ncbi:subtilisin-like protease SBT1.5 [Aristolochia californica]|uniref:subtilisin-like protease SBT1.5 n=1 Tax=Aristolochia californica TaxID=171875 RepID=UPI0035D950BA